jgi:hypothetical protein
VLYQPGTTNYMTDKIGVGPFTRADLVAKVMAGDTLSVMGVPPVSGQRMGLDRNWNGVLDSEETLPLLTAAQADTGVSISWSPGQVGVVLEFSESLSPPNWRTATDVRNVEVDQVHLTIPTADHYRFYRLRGL